MAFLAEICFCRSLCWEGKEYETERCGVGRDRSCMYRRNSYQSDIQSITVNRYQTDTENSLEESLIRWNAWRFLLYENYSEGCSNILSDLLDPVGRRGTVTRSWFLLLHTLYHLYPLSAKSSLASFSLGQSSPLLIISLPIFNQHSHPEWSPSILSSGTMARFWLRMLGDFT